MSSQSETKEEYAEYSGAIRWIILGALMMGTLMQVIDTSIVNVALPQMMGNLGATMDQISWVSTGYIISNVILLPLTGWLSSRFGRKRYLTASIILFTIASFFCGTARTLNMLVLFRIIQGIGGAALLSTAQATMMEIFPRKQLGMVQAIYGVGVMVGPTVGPTLGGWITDNYSWPWVFFINIPIGIIAATLAFVFVHDSKYARDRHRIDLTGIGLLAIGLGSLQTLLEKGNSEDWFESTYITVLAVAAVVALVSFIVWELRVENPVVNLRVLKNRGFAAGTIFTAVLGFGLYGGTFIIPIYLQQLRHYTAQQTGLILLPGAIATAIVMPMAGKLVNRFAARNLVALGAVGFVWSMLMLHMMTLDTGPSDLFTPLVLRGAAMGLLYLPMTLATLTSLKGREIAEGTGLYNLSRQIGGSFGIAILSTFVDHRTKVHRAVLVEHINLYNSLAVQRLHMLQAGLAARGESIVMAKNQAIAVLDGIVQRQSSVMAFEDVFMVVAVFFFLCLPLLLLFDKGRAIRSHK